MKAKGYVNFDAIHLVRRGSYQSGVALLVLESIAGHVNRKTQTSWPSLALMGFEARASRSGVQKILPELKACGELILIRKGQGRSRPDVWSLNVEQLERQATERLKEYSIRVRDRVTTAAQKPSAAAGPAPEPEYKIAAKRVPARRKRQPETVWPAGFALDAEMRQIAVKAGMPIGRGRTPIRPVRSPCANP